MWLVGGVKTRVRKDIRWRAATAKNQNFFPLAVILPAAKLKPLMQLHLP